MRVIKTIKPGQHGFRRFVEQYGERLINVRDRENVKNKSIYTTVELIIDQREYLLRVSVPRLRQAGKGLSIKIVESPFVPSEWDITYCPNSKMVCLINGLSPNGVDGNMPKTYLSKLVATANGKQYKLDSSNMFNVWGSRPLEYPDSIKYFVGVCQHKIWCTFRGIFSDAAGSFVAEWQIRQGVPERTIITSSNDVVNLFIKNIEPPVYE